MEIVSENTIHLYGKTYKEITYDTGETILKRYSFKYLTWITLQFSETEHVEELKALTKKCLLNKNL